MGNPLSKASGPSFPEKILLKEFLNGTMDEKLQQTLLKYHFAIFSCDEDTQRIIQEYKDKGNDFFNCPKDEKMKYAIGQKDELIKAKVNLGYLEVQHQKEFLKLQKFLDDKEETEKHLPNNVPDLREKFFSVYDRLGDIANKCLDTLSQTKDSEGNTYMSPKLIEDLKKFDKSSISYIHYYPAKKSSSDDTQNNSNETEYRTSEDKSLDNLVQEGLVYPSSTHTDTGILTLIICSEVPGLQVWDHIDRKWIEVEKIVQPKVDLFCVLGRKSQLFANPNYKGEIAKACTHRVALPLNTERNSLLFFLDSKG